MMEALNLSHRPTFRSNYVRPALEAGLIEMTIPDKPRSSTTRSEMKAITRCPQNKAVMGELLSGVWHAC